MAPGFADKIPTTNQLQLGSILAAHYTATRASVDDWLRRRDQYLILFVTGTAAICGVFVTKGTSAKLLDLGSFLNFVVLAAYVSADFHVAYLCKWLKLEYTELLERYVQQYGVISLKPWHWDNSLALSEFYGEGIGQLRYVFVGLTFVGANAIALFLAKTITGRVPLDLLVLSIVGGALSVLVLNLTYYRRKQMAWLRLRNQTST